MVATWIPIFAFAYFVPVSANSQFYWGLERVIDENLFGQVGMWSSRFPFVAKVVANYICLFSPVFAVVFVCRAIKYSTFEGSNYDGYSRVCLTFILVSWMVILVFLFYIFYVGSTDLVKSRRFFIFGEYRFLYAMYSSGIMFVFYVLALVSCVGFSFLPVVIVRRMWKK
jgi:hypothetical protein